LPEKNDVVLAEKNVEGVNEVMMGSVGIKLVIVREAVVDKAVIVVAFGEVDIDEDFVDDVNIVEVPFVVMVDEVVAIANVDKVVVEDIVGDVPDEVVSIFEDEIVVDVVVFDVYVDVVVLTVDVSPFGKLIFNKNPTLNNHS
jgi:hypothetical protein